MVQIPYSFLSEKTEEIVKKTISRMLEVNFRDKSSYEQEKFISIFAEYIMNLESNMYYREGIHTNQDYKSATNLKSFKTDEEVIKSIKLIEETIEIETKRLSRNFSTILI